MKKEKSTIIPPSFIKLSLALMSFLIFSSLASAQQDVNIKIIGSNYDTSKALWTEKSRPFNPTAIKAQLEAILDEDPAIGTANVVYEDRYKFNNGYETFNFASWFHWPYPAGAEVDRWKDLRGENGTEWDYVILIGDSYTIEQMPGLFAHGVAKVSEEVAKGGAETILLMPWPSDVSVTAGASSVAHYKEVVYRVGRSGGFKVAPAAIARQDAETAGHVAAGITPLSNDGAFLCAASIYSRIWGASASNSTYSYNDTLADSVNTTVVNNIGAQQYTGKWSFQSPFKGFNFNNNDFNVRKAGGGTSTEDLIMSGSNSAISRAGIRAGDDPTVTFYNGRVTFPAGGNKDYRNRGNVISFGHYFPTEAKDKDLTLANIFSRDIVYARAMKNEWHEYRYLPHRFLAGGLLQHDPAMDIYPGQHMYGPRQTAIGSYIATILTGYCSVNSKPATITDDWIGQKVGYEMAWNVSTLQARAPGFKVKPARATVGFASPETVTVEFYLKPKADVTVTVTSTSTDITMSSQTLTFTPDNHDTPQQVTFLANSGAAPGANFNLEFNTSSDDEVYDDLKYIWSYKINQAPTANSKTVSAYTAIETPITLTSSDPNGEARSYIIVDQPQHGTVSISGDVAVYISNAGFTGADTFTFKVNDGVDDSMPATVTLNVIPTTIYDFNLINNGSAELAPIENYDWVEVQGNWGRAASTVDGSWAFRNLSEISSAEMYQDVDVSFYSPYINAGVQSFEFSGQTTSGNDESIIYLEFRDATEQVLDTYQFTSYRQGSPSRSFSDTRVAPVNTVKIRVRFKTVRRGGRDNESKFDKMRLVALQPTSAFVAWSGGAEFSGDANSDGVSNGIAWVLGAEDASSDLAGMMPTVDVDSEEAYLIFNFRRRELAHLALGDEITAQYSGNLVSWNTAIDGQNGVVITSSAHPTEAGIDMVTVKVPKNLGHNGALFMRLKVTE